MTDFPTPPEWTPPPREWTPPPPPSQPGPFQPAASQPAPPAPFQPTPSQPAPSWGTAPEQPQVWTPTPQPPAKRGHGKLIGSVTAVVVLAGGGAATYVAFAASDSGAGSPKAAVQKVIGDLEQSDLVGVLDDLAPGERTALSGPLHDNIKTYKRIGVLAPKANPSAVSGITFSAKNLSYAGQTVKINDHVQIVKITGGTVELSAQAAKLPFTQKFFKLVHAPKSTATQRQNLAGKDIRIAAEKVGGHWYASLFYTAADYAAQHHIPTAADHVPAVGAASPEAAVETMVRALLSGDTRSALALISPDELGAVHDYGGMILKAAPKFGADGVTLHTLDLATTPIADGGQRVTLKKLVLSVHGHSFTIAIDESCAQLTIGAQHKKICPTDAAGMITGFLGGIACSDGGFGFGSSDGTSGGGTFGGCAKPPTLTKAQQTAIADVFTGLTRIGVATAKSGGQWFVTPVRTYADIGATVLSGLQGDDLFQLAKLAG